MQAHLLPHVNQMRQYVAVVSVCHKRLAATERETAETAQMSLAVVSTLV
jgi:hypothetical protein